MNADQPLYERDPAAWHQHLAEGNARQPRKRVGADVLLRDHRGRILLVDPKYKPDWDLPGGMSEANEPPAHTAERELREELGLDLEVRGLLCIDWVSPHGPWDDSLMFIYDGGILSEEQIHGIKLVDDEIASFAFCTEHEAEQRLRPYFWRRVQAALDALNHGGAVYVEDGRSSLNGQDL